MEPLSISDGLRLKILQIAVAARIDETQLQYAVDPGGFLEAMVLRCTRRVAYFPADPRIQLWATWWDAFKCRWFPQWALRRWPPVFRIYEARAYFQSLPIPPHGDQVILYSWAERSQTEAPK